MSARHLSTESSILTPFCIFFDVSTVRNISTIRQSEMEFQIDIPYIIYAFWLAESAINLASSIHQFKILPDIWSLPEQSYGRKLTISKPRIALTPLKTLEIALVIPALTFTRSKSNFPSTLIDDQYFVNTKILNEVIWLKYLKMYHLSNPWIRNWR